MSEAVMLQDIRRSYTIGDQTTVALSGVSLTIESGEFVAIVGPSGSGKSTMMHLIGCLDRPDSGTVRIAGTDTADLDDDTLTDLRARSIGFVFQQFNLLSMTSAVDNVAAPLRYQGVARGPARDRAAALLERLGLGHRLEFSPARLSGGQQQRVAIARALVTDAPIVLADEPTGALDSGSGAEVMQILNDIHAEGRTVVMITHDLDLAARARRRVHILDGAIALDETTLHAGGRP
jgi:putative ABC transport system ATP-binding protein